MINNNERLKGYLNSTIGSLFKIVPLYEEENEGLLSYVESLFSNLSSLDEVISMNYSKEYIDILTSLMVILKELRGEDTNDKVIKREAFKSIRKVKIILKSLEGDVDV